MTKKEPKVQSGRPVHEKVTVAYLRTSLVHGAFHECLTDLLMYDVAHNRRVVEGGGRVSYLSGPNVAGPRNEVVKRFLKDTKADWLLMLDSDMTFPPDLVERLLANANPDTAPIVGGLCFGFDSAGRVLPTIYQAEPEKQGGTGMQFARMLGWVPNSLTEVAGTGTACLMAHRSVFERITSHQLPGRERPGFNEAYPWFQETSHGENPVSEDVTFCLRARIAGMPVHVDTGLIIGHLKEQVLNLDSYIKQPWLLEVIKENEADRQAEDKEAA